MLFCDKLYTYTEIYRMKGKGLSRIKNQKREDCMGVLSAITSGGVELIILGYSNFEITDILQAISHLHTSHTYIHAWSLFPRISFKLTACNFFRLTIPPPPFPLRTLYKTSNSSRAYVWHFHGSNKPKKNWADLIRFNIYTVFLFVKQVYSISFVHSLCWHMHIIDRIPFDWS